MVCALINAPPLNVFEAGPPQIQTKGRATSLGHAPVQRLAPGVFYLSRILLSSARKPRV
jgi:hypothetical protein